MKEFKLNKNSWHFKLATKFSIMNSYEADTTICRYFWSVVLGGFAILFLTSLGIAALGGIGFILYDWYKFFTQGFVFNFGVIFTLGAAGASALKYGIEYIIDKKREKRYKIRRQQDDGTYVEPEPGFLKQAYTSWKEKTCHKIVFTYKHD